jgi:hypothetical protein
LAQSGLRVVPSSQFDPHQILYILIEDRIYPRNKTAVEELAA